MPYKDPQKAKESARRRYELNLENRKAYAINWYKENKSHVLAQHQEKSEELKEKCKSCRAQNKNKVKNYKIETHEQRIIQGRKDKKKSIENLTNWYVVSNIKSRVGLKSKEIKKHPEVVENYREQIKLKRKIKEKKNGKPGDK